MKTSESPLNVTHGKWEVRTDGMGATGPTTSISPCVAGGKNWPIVEVACGLDTIAICPDQPLEHIIGRSSKPLPYSAEANAHLISAAPDMAEALEAFLEYYDELTYGNPVALSLVTKKVKTSLAKAKGE